MDVLDTKSVENGNQTIREWITENEAIIKPGAAPCKLKRIIDGRTFNTATAQSLAYFAHEPGYEEYRHQWESLYQARSGAYFLVGEGMSHTPWSAAIPDCNDRMRGHALLPLTKAEAKHWLELREKTAEYAEVFGEPAEAAASEFEGVSIRLPQLLIEELRAAAASQGQTISQLVWSLLDQKLTPAALQNAI